MKLKLKKPSWTEKRDSIRLEVECPVRYRSRKTVMGLFKSNGKSAPGLIVKPSVQGVRLCSEAEIPEGTEVELFVEMEKLGFDRAYHLKGQVVWSKFSGRTKRHEQGVRLHPRAGDFKRWEKFIVGQLRQTDRALKIHSLKS